MTQLYDTKPLALRKARHANQHPLIRRAQKRLQDRLADLKENCPHKISCFDMQFSNNFAGDLKAIYEAMKAGSVFLGVIAGGETLKELKTCLMEAENEVSSGTYPRIAPMMDLESLSKSLLSAGFSHTAGDIERFNLIYSDMVMLMQDIRGAGFANNLVERPRHFSKRKIFERAHEIYKERFPAPASAEEGITATVELLYMHGWKEEDKS